MKIFITQTISTIWVTREEFVLNPKLSFTNAVSLIPAVYSKHIKISVFQKMSENVKPSIMYCHDKAAAVVETLF